MSPITRALHITLYAWNKRIQNAIDDYHQAPTRSCHATRCTQLAADAIFCDVHRKTADAANAAARAKRKAKR